MAFASATMEGVEVECTHCGLRMTSHLGSGQRVRYFRCAGCSRWVSSAYTEVFRADAQFRAHHVDSLKQAKFEEVKGRLERWLSALDDQDPYHLLNVSPLDSMEKIRARYRELALAHHPDRGGSEAKMRELNVAYERVLVHQRRRREEAMAAQARRSQAVLSEG